MVFFNSYSSRVTDYVFSLKVMSWRSVYKWRERFTHLRAELFVLLIHVDQCSD